MKKTYRITRIDLKQKRLNRAETEYDGKKITNKHIKHLAKVITIINTQVE